jgi:uncharacterized protein YndB with AHSA1/START domain
MDTSTHPQPAALVICRSYRATPEAVWQAWTDPQALSQWFGPGGAGSVTAAELDPSVGGRYRIAFSGADGEAHEVSGVYQEVELHRRLVFSWAWKSTPERVSRVSSMLTPQADGTELRFTHDRFFDEAARAGHARGWPSFFERLAPFVESSRKEK